MATDIISAATLLFLVLDPLGNIPIFLSVLEDVAPERRTRVLLRELVLALLVLLAFLFFGQYLLGFLQLSEHAIRIAGGIILFLIAMKLLMGVLLMAFAGEVLLEAGALDAMLADTPAKERELWTVRKCLGEAVKSRAAYIECDTAVPPDKVPDLLRGVREQHEHAVPGCGSL